MKDKHKPGGNTAITEVTLVVLTFKDLILPKHYASYMLSPFLVKRAFDTVASLTSDVEPCWPLPCGVFGYALNGSIVFHYAVDVAAPPELIERAGIALDYGFFDMGVGVAVTFDVIGEVTLPIVGGSSPGIVAPAMLEALATRLPDDPEF